MVVHKSTCGGASHVLSCIFMSDQLLLDVDAATELHQAMSGVAADLDGDRTAVRATLVEVDRLVASVTDDPDPWLRDLSETLREEAADLARRLRMVVFGGPEINAGLLAFDHVRQHFSTIDNRGGEAGERDGVVSRGDLEWAVEHLDADTAAAAQWLLDHEDFFRTVETARDNDEYLAAGASEFGGGGDGDGKLSLADVNAYVTKLDTWATLLPYMPTIDIAAKGGDHDAVMSREDFEAFLADYELPPEVRAAAQRVLDDGAYHDTGGGLVSWGTLVDVASFIPVVGDFIDGAMALYYLSQGRWSEAAMSGIGLLPVPGVTGGSARAANAAADRIRREQLADAGGLLRETRQRTGNFNMGNGTRADADLLGEAWVGPGATWSSNGRALVSADGLRRYRPPSWKQEWNNYQANFEWKYPDGREFPHNGHLHITDP